ncbi:ATP-binding cassette domain-containing protein [Pelagibacterium sp. 26DY04]|uniref:ATP-binding cassette domain-containing protein n=1 Tax=unclassified Pelagibacterium TaxID=2623280 RepID=UPI002814FE5E|nr:MULTISPECIES: ATP-binding cassette domain-containing protein [unclassified Pelagibacterium]WMT85271.1 ATP-binding cassette domain-containing protein [Pelagibacterium sp. 26DY04]WMT90422.1 ATP-binding cassette domain-containing protein [Pelagibacterium sp. H642]
MTAPLLDARGIRRTFGHVRALDGADFKVMSGEIVALIGDNGAGKSTLVKILAGADRPNEGTIFVEGRPESFSSPTDAQAAGIATVYQDLALAADLTPSDNLFLGREVLRKGFWSRFGFLDRGEMQRRSVEQFARLGVQLKSHRVSIDSLSGGQRQSVAIARAAMWARKLVILDEPTAALGVVQTQRVLELCRRIRDEGTSVVLISHNMPQVLEVADRIQVLRLGQTVADLKAADATVDDLVREMTSGKLREQSA